MSSSRGGSVAPVRLQQLLFTQKGRNASQLCFVRPASSCTPPTTLSAHHGGKGVVGVPVHAVQRPGHLQCKQRRCGL